MFEQQIRLHKITLKFIFLRSSADRFCYILEVLNALLGEGKYETIK